MIDGSRGSEARASLRRVGALPARTAGDTLPRRLTTFVGRTAELAELADLLRGSRLLTLIGSGGSGKTRLALEMAAAADFPDGVTFTDLAPAADSAAVATALAHTLGLRDEPGRPRLDSIVEHLAANRVLVVLDNCEHLVDACAALAETLLLRCPALHVLATSREPLDVAGETGWRVPAMSLPGAAATSAASVERSEAVQLFVDRARRVRTGFRVDEGNAAAIAEICRRLEGIPLAVELAAARIRVLGPAQIAAGLDEVFGLLTRGGRTAVARQRTLRASVDWSHDLLTEPERTLFRRLAPFAGGFDLAAAEAVGSGTGLAAHQVLDQLNLLVDKSLVDRQDADNEARFRMLETMRQYAAERLSGSGEDEATRRRHRDHYLEVAEDLARRAFSPEQVRAVDHLVAIVDNLHAAFLWSRGADEPDGALRIATALAPVWRMRGRRVEGCAWLDEALSDTRAASPAHCARALAVRSRIEVDTLDPAAPERVEECVRISRELDDPALLARALVGGAAYLSRGPHLHRALLAEAIALAQDLGDSETLTDAHAWFAIMALCAGQPDEGRPLLAKATALAEAHGNLYMSRTTRSMLGLALLMQGEASAARPLVTAVAREAEAHSDGTTSSHTLGLLAWSEALGGDLTAATSTCARFLTIRHDDGNHEIFARLGHGMAALAIGDPAAAADTLSRGWRRGQLAPGVGEWLGGPWSEALLALGDLDGARCRADESVARTVEAGFHWQTGWALTARARIALADGEPSRAADLASRALTIRHQIADRGGVADVLELLAILAARAESPREAARLLGAASTVRAAAGCHRFAVHHPSVDAAGTAIRDTLGVQAAALAHEEGAALSPAEAVAYASRGRGERKRPSRGWAALTPAELEVAALVAAGLSNKAVAAKLFVSPRTIQTHLTHAYTKLGVTSRMQLAREAREHAPWNTP